MPSNGSTTQRGYGAQHQRQRRDWQQSVATGQVNCRRCGEPIQPGQRWDLGHQTDRNAPTSPEHARLTDCKAGGNRSAGARHSQPPWRRPPEPHPGLLP